MTRTRWAAVVVGVLFLSYVLRIGFFTYALYVVLALVGSSSLMARYGLRGLVDQRTCTVTRARLGDVVDVRVELRHRGAWLVPWVLLEDLTPAALPATGQSTALRTLWPRQQVTLRYRLACTRRGYHQIGPLLLETGDLFGLKRRFQSGSRAHYLTVPPDLVPIGGYDLAAPRPVGEVRVERRIVEDPSRLHGVREWRPGDKLTRIHWRSTARSGSLQTKIYEPSCMVGALLCLDLYEPAYEDRATVERSEFAVTVAASLANYVAQAHQRVGFLSNGRDAADRARYAPAEVAAATRWQAQRLAAMQERSARLRPFEVPVGRGETTFTQILDASARVELSDFQPVGAMLLREYPRLPRDVTLLVVTPRLDRPLLRAAVAMRHSGFVLTVLLIGNHHPTPCRAQLLAAGVRTYAVDTPRDLSRLAAVRL
ncbi:MAG: DUF58 domain-containing protein [Fimbriimonadaceae bacterium]|nr:DUF58 domain-containing protein [Fimbriimonadaceae bacterium]